MVKIISDIKVMTGERSNFQTREVKFAIVKVFGEQKLTDEQKQRHMPQEKK